MDASDFSPAESRQVKEFLKTDAGRKFLQTLDNLAEEKNNLLQTVNLSSGTYKPEETGIRCQMAAAEVRAIHQVRELLSEIGDENANQD